MRAELVEQYHFVYFGVSADEQLGFSEGVLYHHYWIGGNRFLILHCSPDRSALTPIAREPNTALMNFLGPLGFGSAFAALTLRRVGLTAAWRDLGEDDRRRNLLTVAKAQVRLAQDPSSLFPPAIAEALPRPAPLGRTCFQRLFACPRQGRYFGDGGSLVDFYDVLNSNVDRMRREHLPPFGTTTVWRLQSAIPPCDGPCETRDALLPEGVLVAPVIIPALPFHYGPRFAGIRSMY